jgi:small subunit ribosomal protein S17
MSMAQAQPGNRKVREGIVVSDKMNKTVVVAVESLVKHPIYGRRMRRTKRYKAHDEDNRCRIGDRVRIEETRPLSKDKNWRVVAILGHQEE